MLVVLDPFSVLAHDLGCRRLLQRPAGFDAVALELPILALIPGLGILIRPQSAQCKVCAPVTPNAREIPEADVPLFQLELNEFKPRCAGVLDPANFAGILPDEIAIVGCHAPVRVARNDFRQHAAMDIDA